MTYKFDIVDLETLCLGIYDCPHSTPKWQNEGVPVIRNYNLKDGYIERKNLSYVDEQTYLERVKRATPEAEDIIISREAPMGVVGIVPKDFKCCLGQRLVLLKINKDICHPSYLLYVLMSNFVQQQIRRIDVTGSIVSNLNISDMKKLKIPVYSLDEQIKVADTLSNIDEKIALNNQINATLEQMAKTLYDYWFVQFDFPDDNGKPYKSSGGEMVYNETLKREIPKGWDVKKLADWIKTDKSGDWGQEEPKGNYQLEVTCIRGADINPINNQGIIEAPTRFILEKNANKLLSDFDFVIEISGGSPTQSTGRIASISPSTLCRFDKPLICSNFCKAISLKDNSYFYNFAFLWNQIYDNDILFRWKERLAESRTYYLIILSKAIMNLCHQLKLQINFFKKSM